LEEYDINDKNVVGVVILNCHKEMFKCFIVHL